MKFYPARGVISKLFGRKTKQNVEVFEAFKDTKCCGLSCCENVVRMVDKDNGGTYVAYFLDGVWTVQTEADYQADVAAGTFNY